MGFGAMFLELFGQLTSVVVCSLTPKPYGICISQVQALYLLLRHSYSTYKGIIHSIFALQLLILSNCKA